MLILVIGQGAREHAITHTLLKDPSVEVVCAPGNPGIAKIAKIEAVDSNEISSVVALAKKAQTRSSSDWPRSTFGCWSCRRTS